jgi:hypothetical protein
MTGEIRTATELKERSVRSAKMQCVLTGFTPDTGFCGNLMQRLLFVTNRFSASTNNQGPTEERFFYPDDVLITIVLSETRGL